MRITSLFNHWASSAVLSTALSVGAVGLSTTACADDYDYKHHDNFLSRINWQLEPYVGADAFVRNMRYKDEPTHPFQEHLDTFQPFVGLRLHKYFGVEAGYQRSEKGTKTRLFDQLQMPQIFGSTSLNLSPDNTLNIDTNTIVKGWSLNLVGFYPICKDWTSVFLKVGYSNLDIDQDVRFILTQTRGDILAGFQSGSDFVSLHDSTGMLSLALGVTHNFSRHFGGRAFIEMNRTSRIDLNGNVLILSTIDRVRGSIFNTQPHNSINYGVGFYYNW